MSDAQAVLRNWADARQAAQEVRGSMRWKTTAGKRYLVRVSPAGAEKSLGPEDGRTTEMYGAFHRRKEQAQARLKAMRERMDEMRRLNRAYRVGRVPTIVVRCLHAIDEAGLAGQFLVVGTHALYAYETAAGVRVESGALATQDLDVLFDVDKLRAFTTRIKQSDARSFINVLRRADPSFRVRRDQLQTAVNDSGFEVDVIRRVVTDGEDDFWAVQADQRQRMASGRKFEQMVVSATGEMAVMRTLHPLDFIRLKQELSQRPGRDPLKAPKDQLQAETVQAIWDEYLEALDNLPR
ncbi:MAG: GSU2403 family nucleotidyltransferase fold protein [Acidovorax sp.]|uniref:GSU2403 family nucleotidyltransferase fold protein n=1 Tax=Acidovorax sp. TaxID=1872122 RepID=UPI0039E2FFA9